MIYLLLAAAIVALAGVALNEYHRAERMAAALREIASAKAISSGTVQRLARIAEEAL